MELTIILRNTDTGDDDIIKGTDVDDVFQKVTVKLFLQQAKGKKKINLNNVKIRGEIEGLKKKVAMIGTEQIKAQYTRLKNILDDSYGQKINLWDELENNTSLPFEKCRPDLIKYDDYPSLLGPIEEPKRESAKYIVKKKMTDFIFTNKYNEALKNSEESYCQDLIKWKEEKERIEALNKSLLDKYEKHKKEIDSKNSRLELKWTEEREIFEKKNNDDKLTLSLNKKNYLAHDKNAIQYFNYNLLMRGNPALDNIYNKQVYVNYNQLNKILYVEYDMPNSKIFFNTKEIKYNATNDVFIEVLMNDSDFTKFYDETIYKLSLKILYDIFNNDSIESIEQVALNGYVNTIDDATGMEIRVCIISVMVLASEFNKIIITQVDPKACFKKLKGIGASKLFTHTPIAPIITFDKTDNRFREGKGILNSLDNTINLASMGWEDFEHLIREIFEKEFSINGGEVKVTQASRDGGVDAVAFDPDPIRGGKIVIQAKRYTNIVGVSAVRDLYGTVMNEGATKGILVTTSDYGPDSYEFAKDKPITLLNGGNLLHLLQKHGQSARIDIEEARKMFHNE
jgi:restriction system protein